MVQTDTDSAGRGKEQGANPPQAQGSVTPVALGGLFMVVGWRTIAVFTTLAVLTAAILATIAWPFWDARPREVIVSRASPEVPTTSDLEAGRREIGRLTQRIGDLETEIAERRSRCAANSDSPQATASGPDFDCSDTCRLCRENQRELRGDVSVSLSWDTRDDLDLHLVCPTGETIKYNNRSACGGNLNVDMNVDSNLSSEPIENITLTEASPPGRYRILVHFFQKRQTDNSTPFRISLNNRGQTQSFAGQAVHPRDNSENIIVHEFEIGSEAVVPGQQEASLQLRCEECNCNGPTGGAGGTAPSSSSEPGLGGGQPSKID